MPKSRLKQNEYSAIKKGSEIFVLPVDEDFIIYNPLQNITALVNRNAVREIKKSQFSKGVSPLLSELLAPGEYHPGQRQGNLDPIFLGVIPSRRCNMSCIYCGFGAGRTDHKRLPLKLAVQAVDYMAELAESMGKREYDIHFFGGEPFIEGEIIDTVVHRARQISAKIGLIPHFEASTNGYFGQERLRFVGDYIDRVVLSLDGFADMHNKTRPAASGKGSFDRVFENAKYLSRSSAELCLRCCVSSENVNQLPEIADWFCQEFQPAVINFETLSENKETRKAGLKPPLPFDFAIQWFRAAKIVWQHGIGFASPVIPQVMPQNSFCPVGKDAVILLPDGSLASCYLLPEEWLARGIDFTIGRIKKSGEMQIDLAKIKFLRHILFTKKRCQNCFCKYSCAGGCHVNNTYPGSSTAYNDFCRQTRMMMIFYLFKELDMAERIEALIQDREQLERIAGQPSDHIGDFTG